MRKQLNHSCGSDAELSYPTKSLDSSFAIPFGYTYLNKKLYEVQGTLNTETVPS